MRTFGLLTSLLLLAAPALSQESAPAQLVQAATRLESGLLVQVEDSSLVVRDGESVAFRATLGVWRPVIDRADGVPVPQARSFAWNYPHLEDIVFIDLRVETTEAEVPALTVDPDFEHRTRMIRPHDGSGSHGPVSVDTWMLEDDAGYTAVVRLDRARATERGDGVWSFEVPGDRAALAWPMAVVSAPTREELEARIGQALLAFDGAGVREDPQEWWRIPTLCGMCQQQQVPEVELDLQDRDSALLLRVRTRVEHEDHATAVAEGLEIEGHSMGQWLSGQQGSEAWYVVPFDEPVADALIAVAVSGDARVRARLNSGRTCEVPTVRVLLDPAFQDRIYESQRPDQDQEWPNHLSADLVNSWPNPFRASTTIEITVPGTIEEAFDLEPELLARVQPGAEPPFGPVPTVQVKVFNVSGQLVNVLDTGPRTAGRFTVSWNGQDLQGQNVASGAYYIHVAMEEWSVTRRVLLLRN